MEIKVKSTSDDYEFYIGGMLMPVTPSGLKLNFPTKNETLDLANGKTYTVINDIGLISYEFSLLIPNNSENAPFANYPEGFKHPSYYLGHFEQLLKSKKPFQLVVINKKDSEPKIINVSCTIKDYGFSLDAEKYGEDYFIDLKLERYEAHQTENVKLVATDDGVKLEKEKSSEKKPSKKTHVVKKGETITIIVKNHYGNTKKLWDVVRKNNVKNGFLEVGQVIEFV